MREPDENRGFAATELVRAWSDGDDAAFNQLVALVERELHQLARAYMRRERSDHTLPATALLNEVLLRMLGQRPTDSAEGAVGFSPRFAFGCGRSPSSARMTADNLSALG
jgi:hypothetical protein